MKIKLIPVKNVYEIVDAEDEKLIGKRIILEFTKESCYFKRNRTSNYLYVIDDEILNEFNEIIGYWKELNED